MQVEKRKKILFSTEHKSGVHLAGSKSSTNIGICMGVVEMLVFFFLSRRIRFEYRPHVTSVYHISSLLLLTGTIVDREEKILFYRPFPRLGAYVMYG